MKTKRLEYIGEVLAEQINHWMLFPAAMTVIGIASQYTGTDNVRPGALLWAVCSLFPLIFFWVREKTKRFTVFAVLHLCIGALALLIPVRTNVERFLCAACGAGYLIYSFSRRMRDIKNVTEPAVPPIALGISAFALLLQNMQGRSGWDSYYVIALVAVFALYSLHSYIHRYLDFLVLNESSTGYLPASDMFRSGMGLAAGYTLAGSAILLLGSGGGWVTALRDFLRKWLFAALRFILSLIPTDPPEEVESPLPSMEPAPVEYGDVVSDSQGLVFLWEILEKALAVILVLALIYLVIKGVRFLIGFIRKRFARGFVRRQRTASDDATDVREKCDIEKNREQKEKKNVFGFLTPAQRVRKLYKKKVLASAFELTGGLKGDSSRALSLLTARECAEKLQARPMAELYELARYSDQEIGRDTLRQMKQICAGGSAKG